MYSRPYVLSITYFWFTLLDDGDGLITHAEFVAGIPKMKGHARGIDLLGMQRQGGVSPPSGPSAKMGILDTF